MARCTHTLSGFSTLVFVLLLFSLSGIVVAARDLSTSRGLGLGNVNREYLPDGSNVLPTRRLPSQKRIHSQRSPHHHHQIQNPDTRSLVERQNPADALAMMMAAQSTLSLLEAQRTRSADDIDTQQPTSTTPLHATPVPTSFVAPQHRLPSSTSLPLPSESAIQNFLLPTFPGEDHNLLPHITAADIIAVVVVGFVVIIILVLFFIPRRRAKPPSGTSASTPKPRYVVQSPDLQQRYSSEGSMDLEKGEEEADKHISSFQFPPIPSPAHTTGHDIPPNYSTPRFQ